MKFLFDYFPILLFFIVYKIYGIYPATAIAIAASVLQNIFYWVRHKKLENMHLITLGVIVVFGGATLIFQNKAFIMWKPTVAFFAFALVFLGSQFYGDKNLMRRMMGHVLEAPDNIWRNANIAMALSFIFLGLANIYVANFYFEAESLLAQKSGAIVSIDNCLEQYKGELLSLCNHAKEMESVWVNFKLFGTLAINLVFMIAIVVYIAFNGKQIENNNINAESTTEK